MHSIAGTQKILTCMPSMGEYCQQKHNQHAHQRRWNVTTSVVGLDNGHIHKNLTQNGEPQTYSWECRRRRNGMCAFSAGPNSGLQMREQGREEGGCFRGAPALCRCTSLYIFIVIYYNTRCCAETDQITCVVCDHYALKRNQNLQSFTLKRAGNESKRNCMGIASTGSRLQSVDGTL